jgi:hypothetical protein
VDRDVLIVTNQEADFSFQARFSLEESENLSNVLKEKYEANVRSRGRNLSVVKTALMQHKELNPDVLAHIASFSTGRKERSPRSPMNSNRILVSNLRLVYEVGDPRGNNRLGQTTANRSITKCPLV